MISGQLVNNKSSLLPTMCVGPGINCWKKLSAMSSQKILWSARLPQFVGADWSPDQSSSGKLKSPIATRQVDSLFSESYFPPKGVGISAGFNFEFRTWSNMVGIVLGIFTWFYCAVLIACEQGLCLGTGWKNREEREGHRGRAPLPKTESPFTG